MHYDNSAIEIIRLDNERLSTPQIQIYWLLYNVHVINK